MSNMKSVLRSHCLSINGPVLERTDTKHRGCFRFAGVLDRELNLNLRLIRLVSEFALTEEFLIGPYIC